MARWHSCNVLELRPDQRRVWQFDARNGSFPMNREQAAGPGEPLPANIIAKNWGALFQKKLNVAWLPPENVFIRVAQFPKSSPEETRAMVELQLEKLSPIPVGLAVWSFHVLPHSSETMQTIAVTIVSRSVVEEFLGELEAHGYLADRLESPLLDQLQSTTVDSDGAWIYPEVQGGKNSALVAWWYNGVLQSVDFLSISPGADRVASLRDQLLQMAWAGELEGWLTAPPQWHLVADGDIANDWLPALEAALGQGVEVIAPVPTVEIASRTAKRAAHADPGVNLLPSEFAVRYQRQFVDRLWMRGLGAVLVLYLIGLAVYFVALSVLNHQTGRYERDVRATAVNYTNYLELKGQFEVLKERSELKFAALDVWEAVAELLPENLTLESLNFNDGREVRLSGSAPSDAGLSVIEFSGRMRKATKKGRPGELLFDANVGDRLSSHSSQAGINWSFSLTLKQGEAR